MSERFFVFVCLWMSHSSASFSNHSLHFLLFLFISTDYSSVAMATVAPPCFFLLCWLLRAASSAFPEEPGPLNFIPTEGTDPLTFSPSSRLLPCLPLTLRCPNTHRVLHFRSGWWRRPGVVMWAVKVKLALTRRVLTGVQVKRCGVTHVGNESRV